MSNVRINYLARRNPHFTHEEWVRRWRQHWRLAESQPTSRTVRRYIQCEVVFDREQPAHDGAASSEYYSPEARHENRADAGYHAIMQRDELQVFDRLIEECSFVAEHTVVSGPGVGPYKILRYLRCAPEVSESAFGRMWRDVYAQEIQEALPESVGYAQNAALPGVRNGLGVAGSDEIWFDDRSEAIEAVKSLATGFDPDWSESLHVAYSVVTSETILKAADQPGHT